MREQTMSIDNSEPRQRDNSRRSEIGKKGHESECTQTERMRLLTSPQHRSVVQSRPGMQCIRGKKRNANGIISKPNSAGFT